MNTMEKEICAWIGIDWADQKHDVSLYEVATGKQERTTLQHSPEAVQEWIGGLRSRFAGIGKVAVVLEQGRGALLNALMGCEFLVLYIVNPKSLSSYREAFYGSGAKSDPVDADLLRDMVRRNADRFRAWQPDDPLTRSLRLLTEGRRKLVDDTTAVTNQLMTLLKGYYPQALDWVGSLDTIWTCDFLQRWPTLQSLQGSSRRQIVSFYERHPRRTVDLDQQLQAIAAARPLTQDEAVLDYSAVMVETLIPRLRALINGVAVMDKKIAELFHKHPDRPIFESFPGAGAVMAPRLLAAFGADRDRFQTAAEVQQFSGIAPVTEESGRRRWVHRRFACAKFLRQTFHEFADHSRRWCRWAKAYYQLLIDRGNSHHSAVRALAYKWIRILFRCWRNRTPYCDATYEASLNQRQSPLSQLLPATVEKM